MNELTFSLQPSLTDGPVDRFQITGNIGRRSSVLSVRYTLIGRLQGLSIPDQAYLPARRDRLWEETCFELFLAVKGSRPYWEFNLSPAGHWNVYRFEDYRRGMQKESAFAALPFSVGKHSDALSLALDLDLDRIVQAEQAVEIALSAVIQHRDGDVSYWALTHRGREADFHWRDGFIVQL